MPENNNAITTKFFLQTLKNGVGKEYLAEMEDIGVNNLSILEMRAL